MGASHSDLCGVVAGRLPLRVRCEDGSPSELITEPFLARACPECIEGKRAMGMVERDFQHPARPRSTGIATCGGQLSWVLPASGLVHDQGTYQGIGCRRLMPAWVRADLKPAPTVSSWVHNTFPNTWSGVALGLPMGKQSSHSLRVVRIRNVGLRDPASMRAGAGAGCYDTLGTSMVPSVSINTQCTSSPPSSILILS